MPNKRSECLSLPPSLEGDPAALLWTCSAPIKSPEGMLAAEAMKLFK
jgi:hypothetical protein